MWSAARAFPSALALCSGIVAGYRFIDGFSVATVIVVGLTAILLFWICARLSRSRKLCFAVFFGALGLVLGGTSHPAGLPAEVADRTGTLTGHVVKVTRTPEMMRVVVEATEWQEKNDPAKRKVAFRAQCMLRGHDDSLIAGVTVAVRGKLRRLEVPNDVPYQTDYGRFLFIDGVVATMSPYLPSDYSVTAPSTSVFSRIQSEARRYWLGCISDAGFDNRTTAFFLAVIGGEDILLSDDIEQQFRNSGLAHVLAISGLHISLLLFLLTWLFYPLKLFVRARGLYFALLCCLILGYAFVTGGAPSACRAALTGSVMLMNRAFEVKSNPVQSLSLAVIILLCLNPLWVFLPGFQFSVCAVLGIIAFRPVFDLIPLTHRFARSLWTFLMLPLAAVTGTLVPTLFYFHGFSLNFWVSNVFASLFFPSLMIVGFVGSILSAFGLKWGLVVWLGDLLYGAMLSVLDFLGEMLPAGRITFFPDVYTLVFIAGIILCLYILINRYSHLRGLGAVALLTTAAFLLPEEAESGPVTEIYIPRHFASTDVIIVHDRQSYVWTNASDSISLSRLKKKINDSYSDFFKRRGITGEPRYVTDVLESKDLNIAENRLEVNGFRLLRVDSVCDVENYGRFDVALVSSTFRGKMKEVSSTVRADSILIAPDVHYSRAQSYKRQLDAIDVPFRLLRERGYVWQSR